jgi:hypothetical protein
MAQILASSKVPANKYDNFSVDPNKVLPRVDIQQLAANFKEAYEVFQGYSLSGDEGSNEAIANLLSIIGVGDVDTYKDSLTKMIQTAVSNASRLEVDGASTANAIILNEPTIGNPTAPDGNDYTKSVPLPFEYVDGLSFIFRATDNNTGSTTIQIPNLTGLAGAVDLLDEQENSLVGGEIVANKYYKIVAKTVSTVKKFLLIKRDENVNDWVKISSAVASNDSTIDFTGLNSTYAAYKLIIDAATPSTDGVAAWIRTSTDGGATYDNGASDYAWGYYFLQLGVGTGNANDGGDSQIRIAGQIGNGATEDLSMEILIFNPSGSKFSKVSFSGNGTDSGGTHTDLQGSGLRLSADAIDAFRFLFSSGNVASGSFTLYGLRS